MDEDLRLRLDFLDGRAGAILMRRSILFRIPDEGGLLGRLVRACMKVNRRRSELEALSRGNSILWP